MAEAHPKIDETETLPPAVKARLRAVLAAMLVKDFREHPDLSVDDGDGDVDPPMRMGQAG